MRLGIVGHEAEKLTECKGEVKSTIYGLFHKYKPELVVSGRCHLGGVDILAVEAAFNFGIPYLEFPPETQRWEGGYKQRNMQIADNSDRVICIVVKSLPTGYTGMRFPYCYHCKTDSHIKSGGCWTARYAGKIGKPYEIIEIGTSAVPSSTKP